MAEHIGEVPDVHRPAERSGAPEPGLQVPDDGLARHQKLVHEDVPRADADPPRDGQCPQPLLVLRPDFEVVVDHRHLAVEEEVAVRTVPLHQVEQSVDQPDQLEAEGLERVVPLAVPVGVGDDRDPPSVGAALLWRCLAAGTVIPCGSGRAHGTSGPYSAS